MVALQDLAEAVAVQVNVVSSGAGNADALLRGAQALSELAAEDSEGGAPGAAAVIEGGGTEALVAYMASTGTTCGRNDMRAQAWACDAMRVLVAASKCSTLATASRAGGTAVVASIRAHAWAIEVRSNRGQSSPASC